MAAPAAVARVYPTGIRLKDGYQTLITIGADPDASFWEKTVKPPSLDGREKIDTTTMHNDRWVTNAARQLIEMGDVTGKASYDPNVFVLFLQILNVETTITITFPDGSTLAFYGYLQKFEFDELAEGTNPEASYTVVVTNEDPTTGEEEDPVFVNVSGT